MPSQGGASCLVLGSQLLPASTSKPGEDSQMVLAFERKVVVRFMPRSKGEPSPSMSCGMRS